MVAGLVREWFGNEPATTEIDTSLFVGSVRGVEETDAELVQVPAARAVVRPRSAQQGALESRRSDHRKLQYGGARGQYRRGHQKAREAVSYTQPTLPTNKEG